MSALIFLLLCFVFSAAAYFVVRSFFRYRLTFGELMSRVIPAPTHPVELGTWGQVTEIWRKRQNSAVFAEAADRYRRIIPACTDAYSVEQMDLTYRTFLRNHSELTRALLAAIVNFCLREIAKERCRVNMDKVERFFANEVILIEEMSEVMDYTCVAVLEGQFGT